MRQFSVNNGCAGPQTQLMSAISSVFYIKEPTLLHANTGTLILVSGVYFKFITSLGYSSKAQLINFMRSAQILVANEHQVMLQLCSSDNVLRPKMHKDE